MRGELDGVPFNRCPISGLEMPENRIVHDNVRNSIFEEMDKLKVCYNKSYFFDLIVEEWLAKEQAGKDIHKPTD